MVIISLDAVGARDLAYLKTLPNFQKLRAQSGYCDHVESVYPSITYPAHTSIVTGKKPLHHGVVNNLQLQPGRKSPDWMWQKHFIHGKTLYEAAAEKGYVTASIPVSYTHLSLRWIWAHLLQVPNIVVSLKSV